MRSDWRDHAACRGTNPDLFTGRDDEDTGGRPNADNVARALQICATCPVIDDCREFADSCNDVLIVGVWADEYRSRRLAAERQHLTGKGPLAAVARLARTS